MQVKIQIGWIFYAVMPAMISSFWLRSGDRLIFMAIIRPAWVVFAFHALPCEFWDRVQLYIISKHEDWSCPLVIGSLWIEETDRYGFNFGRHREGKVGRDKSNDKGSRFLALNSGV